ncbi:MAG: hypothetical protein ACI9EP_001571 [Oceanospirillaceae bacterium]|jgi:hypothetical protein
MVDCLKLYYDQHGSVTGVPIISPTKALTHRSILESVEAERGPMHYQSSQLAKRYSIMDGPYTVQNPT